MNTIVFIFIYVIEAIIAWQYCTHLLILKKTTQINILGLILTYSLLFVISFSKNPVLNMIFFALLNIIYMFIIYDIRIINTFFHTGVLCLVMNFSELITLNIFPNFNLGFYDGSYTHFNFILLSFISKSFYFIIIRIMIHFTRTQNKEVVLSAKETILLFVVPIATFWIFTSIICYTTVVTLPTTITRMLSISSILLLVLNFVIYYIFYYMSNQNIEYTKLQLQLQRDEDVAYYYQMLLKQDEEQKILIHDINKHLQTLQTFQQNKEYNKSDAYLQEIIHSEALTPSVRICNHELLNAILYRYTRLTLEKNIDFHIDIRNNCLNFIADEHLTSLFCNLLDNALEAAPSMPNPYIELNAIQRNNTPVTTISVINSCRINPFISGSNKLLTKKIDSHRHGFGIKSIDRIIKKYNGSINMYYNEESHTFHTILFFQLHP